MSSIESWRQLGRHAAVRARLNPAVLDAYAHQLTTQPISLQEIQTRAPDETLQDAAHAWLLGEFAEHHGPPVERLCLDDARAQELGWEVLRENRVRNVAPVWALERSAAELSRLAHWRLQTVDGCMSIDAGSIPAGLLSPELRDELEERTQSCGAWLHRVNPVYFNTCLSLARLYQALLNGAPKEELDAARQQFLADRSEADRLAQVIATLQKGG